MGKFWLVTQVKAIDLATHFWCICEYRQGKFWRMAHDLAIFSPPKFPCIYYWIWQISFTLFKSVIMPILLLLHYHE